MTTARSVRCGACGGHAPLVALAPAFPCPFCKATLVVPPELLRELGAYGHAVATAHAEAREQASLAASYQMWAGSPATRAKQTALALGLGIGLPMFLGILGSVLVSKRILPSSAGPAVSVVVMIAAFGGMGAMIWLQLAARRRAGGPEAQARAVACPQCGAPNALAAGAPSGACRYCHAPLVPSHTVMRDVVADARAVARSARIERRRAERVMMTNVSSMSAGNIVPYIAIGPITVLCGLGALSFTFEGLTGSKPFNPGVLVLWGFSGLGVSVLLGIRYFRTERAARWARVTSAVANAHAGLRLETLPEAVHWLDTHWDGEFSSDQLMTGPVFTAVAAWIGGLPALCWIDPVPASEHSSPRVVLLLAAWIPGLSDEAGRPPPRTPGFLGTEQGLCQMGFSVELGPAGIVARLGDSEVAAWRKRPEAALALAPALSMLGAMASAVDARRVAGAA